MKIILSPAKQMSVDTDTLPGSEQLIFPEKTEELLQELKSRSFEELKEIWNCSEKIARQSYTLLSELGQPGARTPALLAYQGIAYQYMAPSIFSDREFSYVQEHLRILSAFYGLLRPMDGVQPYRLEMQSKLSVGERSNLYEFWGDSLYGALKNEDRIIINLASKEYSKAVQRYLEDRDRFISCAFYEQSGGKLVQKGVYVKMARGEMVRYMAENSVEDPEKIKNFRGMGYRFSLQDSSESEYIFVRKEEAQ